MTDLKHNKEQVMADERKAIEYDPFEPGSRFPYETFGELREQCPVAWTRSGVHLLSRHEDIVSVMRNPEVFLSKGQLRAPGVVVKEEDKMLSEADEPRHTWLRKILRPIIGPGRFRRCEPFVVRTCDELVATFVAAGGGEFVADIARPLPAMVMCDLLGLPIEDAADLVTWSDECMVSDYPIFNKTEHGEGMDALPDFREYINAHIEARLASGEPDDDVISLLINARVDGKGLSRRELIAAIFTFIIAGIATTKDMLGFIAYRLTSDPDLMEQIRSDRSKALDFVNEVLRLDTPASFVGREVARDTQIAGTDIAAGERVVCLFASGNRDAAVFEDPDEVRFGRGTDNDSLAFGLGTHFCTGAPLARLEGVGLVNALLDQASAIEFDGPLGERIMAGTTVFYPELKLTVRPR
jgi:cytochrome P450